MKKVLFILIVSLSMCSPFVLRAQCDKEFKQAFAGVSETSIYNTYEAIVAIEIVYGTPEGRVIYRDSEVRAKMGIQTQILQGLIDRLSLCKASAGNGLGKEEMQHIAGVTNCLKSLKNYAQSLSDYVTTKNASNEAILDENRIKASGLIRAFLGLE